MDTAGIDVNKEHTKERFDAFYNWSKEALNKEFNTLLWRHIDISEIDAICKLLDKLNNPDLRILDAGCGSGRLLFNLKKRYTNVIGSDFSIGLLRKVMECAGDSIPLFQAEVENLPFKDRSFDVVLSVRVLQHLRQTEQQKAIREMSRLLKNDGRLILLTYNALTLLCLYKQINMSRLYRLWPRWPLKHWNWKVDDYSSPPELKKMFRNAGLEILNIKGCVFGEPEILKSLKISNFLEAYAEPLFKAWLWLCRVIDARISSVWPFKYLLGRILIEGAKR